MNLMGFLGQLRTQIYFKKSCKYFNIKPKLK